MKQNVIPGDSVTRGCNAKPDYNLAVCILASGSKGNTIFISDGCTSILVDAGLSGIEIERRLKSKGLYPENLDAILVRQGRTAIGDGLSLAVDMVTSVPSRKKVVILLSDGVNNAGVISPDEAVGFAKEQDIQVYTVGMGSDEQVILGYDWYGRPQYAEFDEATLKKIAAETGGDYFRSVDGKTLREIYKTLSEKIDRKKEPTSTAVWFMMLAFVLVGLDLYLRQVKYRVIS